MMVIELIAKYFSILFATFAEVHNLNTPCRFLHLLVCVYN